MTVEIRAFIAIELPEEVKEALRRWQARFKREGQCPAKWVDPDSIHLTLKFLGNVPEVKIADITRAIADAAKGIPPFRLEVRGLGVFPNPNRVQIVWVGVGGATGTLTELQQRLERNLARLGFPPEARAFTPHLTLARVRNEAAPQERQNLGTLIARARIEEVYDIPVNAVNLMSSQLAPAGAIYRQISAIRL